MKEKIILIMLLHAMIVAACSGDDDEIICGNLKIVSINEKGVETLFDDSVNMLLLNENHTCFFLFGKRKSEGTWSLKGKKLRLTLDGETGFYTITKLNASKLSFTIDGIDVRLTFRRL